MVQSIRWIGGSLHRERDARSDTGEVGWESHRRAGDASVVSVSH